MVFSSLIFICGFLPLVLISYFLFPKKARNIVLLIFSWLFYCWGSLNHFPILLITIVVNYVFALLVQNSEGKRKKIFLAISVCINLGILFFFKYYDFFAENLNNVFLLDLPMRYIILPLGISFFTFQSMSYVFDVYQKKSEANKNFLDVALYISLFPELIAGPIIKYKDISTQLHSRTVTTEKFAAGIQRFVIGLSKKVLIATLVGEVTDTIFAAAPSGIDTPTAWLGIICYTFQVYFDFSGYSDMAIGLARMFGFEFLENFNYPYISKSISEFWRRWHISLSTWFRDYLYIPIGGSRKGNVYLHLFIVFVVTGIWHGASWQFLLWGVWNGVFIVLERLVRNHSSGKWHIPSPVKWMYTMFVVIIGLVIFRADSLSATAQYLSVMFGPGASQTPELAFSFYVDARIAFTLVVAAVASLPLGASIAKKFSYSKVFNGFKAAGVLSLFAISIIYLVNSGYSPFIYFQF